MTLPQVATRLPLIATRVPSLAGLMLVPGVLYVGALLVGLVVISLVDFPVNEGSAYYSAVAANLAQGRGLVVDAIWSYATPPLSLPRPAFELWQPLASFVMGGPMVFLGGTFDAAQLGMALVAALLAPLTWLAARDAANALGLREASEVQMLAVGSAVLVAVCGPLLTATALPDSTIPFAVAGLAASIATARSLAVGAASAPRLALLLGAWLGVAWLARHEAIWLGVAALLLAADAGRLRRRFMTALVAGGTLVTAPWLLRNWLTFGTPLPGQTVDNALLTANEQIYAFGSRPSLEAFLEQGLGGIGESVVAGSAHNLLTVLVLPFAPAALVGLISAAWLWRRASVRASSLGVLLLGGGLTYAITSIVFPVASLWGTFQHAAGPLLVGLAVAAVLGADALLRAIGTRRRWQRRNAWLAPLGLVILTLPLSGLQLVSLYAQAQDRAQDTHRLAAALRQQPEMAHPDTVVISDHPIWLSEAAGVPAIALPAEPIDSLLELAGRFDAPLVALYGDRGGYPGLLRSEAGQRCFEQRAPWAFIGGRGGALFAVRSECLP